LSEYFVNYISWIHKRHIFLNNY